MCAKAIIHDSGWRTNDDRIDTPPAEAGRFLDQPAGALKGLTTQKWSPAVPKCSWGEPRRSRVPPGTVGQVQDSERRIVVSIRDEPTVEAAMRPFAQALSHHLAAS